MHSLWNLACVTPNMDVSFTGTMALSPMCVVLLMLSCKREGPEYEAWLEARKNGIDIKLSSFLTKVPYGFMVPSTNSKPYIPNIRPHTVINLKKNGRNVEINKQLAQELKRTSTEQITHIVSLRLKWV